jgi:hypothetical protein
VLGIANLKRFLAKILFHALCDTHRSSVYKKFLIAADRDFPSIAKLDLAPA